MNYLSWALGAYPVGGTGAPLHSSLAFDLSVTALFLPLLSGRKVVLANGSSGVGSSGVGSSGVETLGEVLRAEGDFSLIKLTPGHLRVLGQQLEAEEILRAGRALILGGEALLGEDLEIWRQAAPECRFFNEYGPTEAVVGCCLYEVSEAMGGAVPLGDPIANARIYVLNDHLRPVPPGVVGKLYIGGAGVARGYLGRAELTAERFLPDPFAGDAGSRLYHTGDLARFDVAGGLEFLGRADHQVKIRGYRVELGEIEAVLRSHPGVEEAAVVARRDEDDSGTEIQGTERLVAYLVLVGGGEDGTEDAAQEDSGAPGVGELRQHLARELPEHMVPATYVVLGEMPLAVTGKIDRRALPEPDDVLVSQGEHIAPRTVEEEILAGIWGRVLKVDRVGIDDDYFALGGDSIRTIEVVSLAEEKGLVFTLEDIFRHRTIRALGRALDEAALEPAVPTWEPFHQISPEDRRRLPDGVEDAFPLTQLQAGMIFHHEAAGGTGVYHDIFSFHVRGTAFDADALEESVRRLIERHPALRTTFGIGRYSEPLQIVHRQGVQPLGIGDLRDLGEAEQEERLAEWMREELERGFDLAKLPLMRYQVFMRGENRFQFIVSFHHAIIDGWSDATMLTELAVSVARLGRGEELPFEAPKTRHSQFVALERQALASPETEGFWRRQLHGLPTLTLPREIPADEAERKAVWQRVEIPQEVSDGLERVARRAAVPIKNVLLAAHLRVLMTLHGEDDVVTCITSSGRPETSDGERVLGLFLNSMPLRLHLGGGTWLDLATEAFELERATLPHRRYPLAEMQRWFGGRRLSESSFYFTHYHVYHEMQRFSDFEMIDVSFHEATSFPVVANFRVDPFDGRVRLDLTCDGRLFSDDLIRRFAGYYGRALAALASRPEGHYGSVDLLSAAERAELLDERGDGGASRALARPAPTIFVERAAAFPEASAIFADATRGEDGGVWSFAELESRSRELAEVLVGEGFGRGDVVGVFLERTPDLLAALLGVWRAGAAWLPLDPIHPDERISFLLEDTGARRVLSAGAFAERLEALPGDVGILDVAAFGAGETGGEGSATLPEVAMDDLAYIIYTSGSTGRPKGVMVSHGALAHYLGWALATYPGAGGGSLVHSSTAFDLTVTSFFVPLLAGEPARLVPEAPGVAKLAEAFQKSSDLSFVKLTPSHVRLLGSELAETPLEGKVRSLVLGGEALMGTDLELWQKMAPEVVIHNEYGPTEAIVGCSVWSVPAGELSPGAVEIGGPIAGARLALLDPHAQPVPRGVVGEIWIGGQGLAWGYLGRPGQTAERFLPDPWSGVAGARLYRTGDLARWREDGVLEFLGRADDQVKIYGHRVEPGEVAAVLEEEPSVARAAVVARGESAESLRLVAYAVPAGDALAPVEKLRSFLETHLPEYMVPATFVALEEIPLTPNGKLDVDALPDPDEERLDLGAAYAPPRGREEEILTTIWAQVLGVDKVGIDDDYFALGGDSIRSVHLVAQAREKGLTVDLNELFAARTIRRLVTSWRDGLSVVDGEEIPRLEPFDLVSDEIRRRLPEDVVDAFPMSRLQSGMIYHRESQPGAAVYHNLGSFHLRTPLDVPSLEQAVTRLVGRHPALRTTFDLAEYGQPLQLVHAEGGCPLEVLDVSDRPAEEQDAAVDAWVEAEKERGFDVETLPLLRFAVHRRGQDTFQFTQSFHHSILDGWSNATLLAELFHDYFALREDRAAELEPPASGMRELVALEERTVSSDASRRYWKELLAGMERTTLPVDEPDETALEGRTGLAEVEISEELSTRLLGLSRRLGMPVKHLLLAVHARVVAHLTGRDDVVTLVTSSGRPETADGDRALGLFLNSIPVRLRLGGGEWQDLAEAAFDAERATLPHQRFPLAEIQNLIGRESLAETAFYFTNFHVYQSLGDLDELEVLGYEFQEETNFTLLASFGLDPFAGRIHFHLAGDRARVGDERLAVFADAYRRALEALAEDPSARYGDLDLLGEAERLKLLGEWSSGGPGRGLAVPAPARFAALVAQSPNAPAVFAGPEPGAACWSFAELDRRAAAVDAALAREGVSRGAVVGVYLERSPELVAALLGTWRRGAAWLPLDATYPDERLRFLLADAGAEVVISAGQLAERLPELGEDLRGLDLTAMATDGGTTGDPGATTLDDLAYVLYTSGSTGRPKGVMVGHRALAHYLGWALSTYARGGGSLVHTSPSFDLTVTSLFVPLLAGEPVILVPESAGAGALAAALDAMGEDPEGGHRTLSFVKLTPSHARVLEQQLAENPESRLGGTTAALILGGEALVGTDLKGWREAAPEVVVHNEYGPTETIVGCSVWSAPAGELDAGTVPIGRPIAGTRIFLVDAHGRPVPAGAVGEIWIGGGGVAWGYRGRPAVTAERFVPDPFGDETGGRLYRTGDLARFRRDGNLEYLGRGDDQVKIRGYRIEPGEVEAVLAEHPSVAAAAVLARGDDPETRRLIAWAVPVGDGLAPVEELRAFLAERLPEHMVPAAFVSLEELPLTPNRKLDRAALPDPDALRPELESTFVRPRTSEEEILAGIWSQILGVEEIGIDDDYFALGGDSIRSLMVVGQAGKKGLQLSIDLLFKYRTIRELVEVLHQVEIESAEIHTTEPFALVGEADRRRLPEDVVDAYPLSELQAGMLYHREVHPEAAIYHDIIRFYLKAPLDLDLLRKAVDELSARHPALRTSFDLSTYAEPLQLIHTRSTIPLAVEDLRHLDEGEQEAALAAWVEAEKARGFDLTEVPLIRFKIHRRTDESFQFALSFHHAIIDGWSDASMLTELALSYLALLRGLPSPFTPPASSYRDFVVLERQAMASEESRRFWLDLMADSPFLEIPRRLPAAEEGAKRGVINEMVPLDDEVTEGLHRLARKSAVPFKNVLLAAHLKALSLLAGERDIVTSLTSSGRLETFDSERVLGLFLNSIPYRLELGEENWRELVQEVYRAEEASLAHRRYPMAEVKRRRGGPLSETAFYFTHYHIFQKLEGFAELEVLGYEAYEETSFTLVANFGQNPFTSRVRFQLAGDETQLTPAQLRSIGGLYRRILTTMAADPGARHDDFLALAPAERHQLLVEWNDSVRERRGAGSILELFAAQVAERPDAVAVAAEEGSLTYAELDRDARRLAAWLHREGAGRESRVGICLERSPELLVALYGTLLAGAAYVPLDPSYPADRLVYMARDARLAALITVESLRDALPDVETPTLCLDRDGEALAAASRSAESLPLAVHPEQLAYVIYTSGSTGRPKGAMNSHRAFQNRILWMQECHQLGPEDRVLQKTPASFDVSVWEFFWPLAVGARLVLARPEGHKDSAYLVERIAETGVTTLHFVPSMLRAFLDEPGLSKLSSLARVIVSGEALDEDLERRFHERFRTLGVKLHNLYGPTEAAVDVTFHACHGEASPVPIGRPIANARILLADAGLRPVPAGSVGELLIGGVPPARGYDGRPALTAESFVPDAWTDEPGARLYRTGDLARFRTDGEIEFLGRRDHQIKLRGLRIEPGEIEVRLASHPGLARVAVVAREDAPGTGAGSVAGMGDRLRLVAYAVANGETPPAVTELEAHLLAELPDYMVPSAFVFLDDFPLTPSGKLDRRALPAPEDVRSDGDTLPTAPRNPREEILAGIWAEVLGRESVGIHERFAELGGHSLLATRVMARVRRAFAVDLPLSALFESPTVAELAERVAKVRGEDAGAAPGEIPPRSEAEALEIVEGAPISFSQERLWFFDQLEPQSSAYNIPTVTRLLGHLDIAALEKTIDAVVERHETLRTTFHTVAGKPVQRVHPVRPTTLERVDLAARPVAERAAEARRLAAAEAAQPFDLGRGPLLRIRLLRLDEEEHQLLLTIHHIVADGWSMGLLLGEIGKLYAAFAAGEPSPLLPLEIQFADFARWQRRELVGERLETQVEFWRQHLAGAPTVLELPLDRPRPPVQTYRGARCPVVLDAEVTAALRHLGQREGATLFMTVTTIFQMLLALLSGQADVSVGTLVAGRTREEIEDLVGFFLNTLVIRLRLGDGDGFRDALARVRDAAFGAYAHQDVPFEKLVDELDPRRDLSTTPFFQVLVVLQNLPFSRVDLPELTLEPLRGERAVANFDLSLILEEDGDLVTGSLEYNVDLFDATTAKRLARRFEHLAAVVATEPDRGFEALPLWPVAERHQVLTEWNDAGVDVELGERFHVLFEAQVARTPEAVAVSSATAEMSYAELERRANRAARRLREHGVGPETLVAHFLERSPEMLVTMLAIWKAGGAYLPLDPLHPPRRQGQVLRSARPSLVVTSGDLSETLENALGELGDTPRPEPLLVEELLAPGVDDAPLATRGGPDSLAYVIYTSGSTGEPKGAMVVERGMVNHLWAKIDDLAIGVGDVIAETASQCFDISVWQFLAALLVGGRVHVVADEVTHDPRRLLEEVAEHGVTLLETVPSLLVLTLEGESLPAAEAMALRWLIPTGEALPPDLCRRWLSLYPEVPLLNAYGPTECSDDVTHAVLAEAPAADAMVPIGRPVVNARLHVLDRRARPTPLGVPGELWVGGVPVGRGYLGDPRRTALAFVPDPLAEEPGARAYRTGDLVRYSGAGDLVFLGRIDHQVKVRGHRIELGEIEAVLSAHAAVREAAVLARKRGDVPGDALLAAYWVAESGRRAEVAELRDHLRERLPEYMVPTAFVALAELPLNPNGKLDRRALPEPDAERQTAETEYVAPRDDAEEILAEIFTEVLEVPRVGAFDHFFNLGGHSLLATRVMARITESFDIELPLRTLFERPVIADLALVVEEAIIESLDEHPEEEEEVVT